MQVTVTFRHMDSTPALKAYCAEKTAHVEKLLIKPDQAHWIFSVEKTRHTAELNVTANGEHIIGKETAEDLYAAIDLVIDKVAAQARKAKGKVKSHKPRKHKDEATVRQPSAVRLSSLASRGARLADGGEIVKTETMQPDHMTAERAIHELQLSGRDFLVFTNENTEQVNICYRRDDGFYGVIEPEIEGKPNKQANGGIPFRFDVWARDEDGANHQARMIRQREITVRPMTVQESVAEMNKSRNHFWVFADRVKHDVKVVYRTGEGEYGLIET